MELHLKNNTLKSKDVVMVNFSGWFLEFSIQIMKPEEETKLPIIDKTRDNIAGEFMSLTKTKVSNN